MNIWIFNHYAVGPNSYGITRHFDLAKELVKMGHQVTIFASSFNHQKREEEIDYHRNEISLMNIYEGVKFYWIRTTKYKKNDFKRIINMFSYTYRTNKIVNKIEETPDIVIGSLMHPLAALLGYKVAKKRKAKFYFEERDLWPQSLIDLGKVSPRNPIVLILSKLELFLYKKADKIIVLFDKAPKYVKSRGIDPKKIIYLPNGVDLTRFDVNNYKELPTEYAEVLGTLKDKFKIMYTGAHSIANNLEALIDIAKIIEEKSDEIHFILIGDGPDKNKLINKAKIYNLSNVTFLPAIKKEYIPSVLKYGDVGIITMKDAKVYRWGISLNKMYDYMAASLPIIMLSSIEDNVLTRENLGIVSTNINDISEELINLSKNIEKLNELAKNAQNYVTKYHTWEKLAKKLVNNFS